MIRPAAITLVQPVRRRLAALAPLDAASEQAIQAAVGQASFVRARREVVTDGAPVVAPRLIVRGWAARVRLLPDGRRQYLGFLLPGDLIGLARQPRPVATATVTALTDLTLCHAPAPGKYPALDRAYAVGEALDEAYLLEQIVRLGRMNAQERLLSLFLELHERLTLSGLAEGTGFHLPLTQEMLADALGLTPVHVNRMLQQARRAGQLDWRLGQVVLRDPPMLARLLGRPPARVSAEP